MHIDMHPDIFLGFLFLWNIPYIWWPLKYSIILLRINEKWNNNRNCYGSEQDPFNPQGARDVHAVK